ncbi:MAG: hypothetical protein NTZ95_01265 [Candidatus Omnitrophica bacterium]|nr:hypothetical protein [Candidatus Omnitrophota bacterium]
MKIKIVFAVIGLSILLNTRVLYSATPADVFKGFFAVSTSELEELKKDAFSKIFEYDYKTCYEKTLALVAKMPDTQVYAREKNMIAVYCLSLNGTPAGIFFEEVDASHTKVLISSASSRAKDWVASNVFSEKIQKPLEKLNVKFGSHPKNSR